MSFLSLRTLPLSTVLHDAASLSSHSLYSDEIDEFRGGISVVVSSL
ncbi:hypothetical protein BVRB_6g155640 [Beta vulgaris subsp. vulgaris]|uniref:Uncharacterized protein n=1 Tax=Beta vulgaris subsp. vulgaris TaxID=3555 RepID=A0A0J8B8U7_BETVV|nr:hypothetical protein BVRB_6g155640 [Beta vulgaris subsp. vulgaris]